MKVFQFQLAHLENVCAFSIRFIYQFRNDSSRFHQQAFRMVLCTLRSLYCDCIRFIRSHSHFVFFFLQFTSPFSSTNADNVTIRESVRPRQCHSPAENFPIQSELSICLNSFLGAMFFFFVSKGKLALAKW